MQVLQESLEIPGTVVDEREIPSDVALVAPLVSRIVDRLLEDGFILSDDRRKMELCLDEGITNAVVHGNGGDFEMTVRTVLWQSDDAWGVVIQDQGQGFSPEDVDERPPEETLWQESGRGIPLMALYMDDVSYYDGGRTLMLSRSRG